MLRTLLLLSSSEYVFSFLFDGYELVKLRLDKKNTIKLTNAIFKGKVKRLAKGMGGVFVSIGLDKEAFLPIKGDKLPRVGEYIIVQMIREPIGDKGAKLSEQIKLFGKYMLYLPQCSDIKCSSKIDKEEKEKLIGFLKPYVKEGGLILRTVSTKAQEEELLKDLENLTKQWENVKLSFGKERDVGLLVEGPKEYISILINSWHEIDSVVVDDPEIWNEVNTFLESFYPPLANKLIYTKDPSVYIKRYNIHAHINKLLSRYVWLKGGGYLVIEQTEALTVIDVNSGEPCGESQEENALKTNLEAAKEIARQIVMRDLGGIILIDFIDMKKQESKNEILRVFQEALGSEACHVQIYGFTKLGLLELVRRKTSESVCVQLSEPCPYCKGSGRIKSKDLLLFELEKDLRIVPSRKLEIEVHPSLVRSIKMHLKKLNLPQVEVKPSEDIEVGRYEIHYEA